MKRIFAFIIDIIIFVPFYFILIFPLERIFEFATDLSEVAHFQYSNFLLIALYFFVVEIVFKSTLGKIVFSLKFQNYNEKYPIRMLLVLRLILKYLSMITIIGIFINLISYLQKGSVWYDDILGLEIIEKEKVKLTDVQENWRNYFR